MTPLIQRAAAFAERAHTGQLRKYTQTPYIEHPRAVAKLVEEAGGDEGMICAAWLHDVLEDTAVAEVDIYDAFGPDITRLVWFLSDVSTPETGNRALRKMVDRAHIARASPCAKAVKLADLIDNTSSIVPHDPNFAVVYLKEKEQLLEVLADAADVLPAAAILLARARQTLADGQTTLLRRHLAAMEGAGPGSALILIVGQPLPDCYQNAGPSAALLESIEVHGASYRCSISEGEPIWIPTEAVLDVKKA